MWKTVLAGTTALAIAGGSLAYAQQEHFGRDRGSHWRPSKEDIAAFSDARIAALHAGLKLNADQEKNWPAVESALRDLAKQREARFAARASADKPTSPLERLGTRADALIARGNSLKKLADAAGPLYNSLDDGQKHRFTMLARFAFNAAGGHHGRGHRFGHGFRHHGGWQRDGMRGERGADGDGAPAQQ